LSGIFGIIHRDGRPLDPGGLERMRGTMAHRGPDAGDIRIDGSVGLGQLMLHSTRESLNERLPWKDPESGLVIVADARIDNREGLFAELGGDFRENLSRLKPLPRVDPLPQSSGITDSGLILAAYKRWGEACVDHLLGDFAFVIWDAGEQKLFAARDHIGIRPFYYLLGDSHFVFASSALGVVAAGCEPKRINQERLADYLVPGMEGADNTSSWFEGVRRMPPAHIAKLSHRGFCMREYWRPDPGARLTLSSDQEYVDAFEDVLTSAIRVRMRSHRPVASMLSGGLDSSTIVAVARKIQGGRTLATISGVSEQGEDCRESSFSRLVIDQGGSEARLLRPSDVSSINRRLRQTDELLEDPFDALWVLHKMIYLSAQQHGQVAVMDGIDGDGVASLTSGYPAFLIRSGNWLAATREIIGMRKNYHAGKYPIWKDYTGILRSILIPEFARKLKRKLHKSDRDSVGDQALISSEFAAKTNLQERQQRYREESNLRNCGSLQQAHAKRLTVPYLTAGIERYGRLAAVCGVEQRQPFLDKRVVEFCLSLPWRMKVRNGWSKYGLRLVAERMLPPEVAWRRSWNQINWKFWMAWNELNRDENAGTLSKCLAALEPCIEKKEFVELSNRYNMGEVESTETVLGLVFLYKWLRRNQ
jgi:asparagine synthase (glutamine-hydrolysing)